MTRNGFPDLGARRGIRGRYTYPPGFGKKRRKEERAKGRTKRKEERKKRRGGKWGMPYTL